MKPSEFIEFLGIAEKLKCNTRHCYTTSGRRESVAEHSWRTAVMAMLCRDEYPDLDIDRVIKMCLIHDLGEAVTGDIPAFFKNDEHEEIEERAVKELFARLPQKLCDEWLSLYDELTELKTPEAKLFKSLDNLEAVIAHNESDISTWIPLEYTENLKYGQENCEWSEWTRALKEQTKKDALAKIEAAKKDIK